MREIVLDTETTGLDPSMGDRLVEIAGIEMINMVPSGIVFHEYINPERNMPQEAFRIHGLSSEFLSAKPCFRNIGSDFLKFIQGARLVIHNAEFDMKFINHELRWLSLPEVDMRLVVDTLALARKRYPGASNSLDALCIRYKVNNSRRTKHGALLDAELLAEVYIELMGGRQTTLGLSTSQSVRKQSQVRERVSRNRPFESHLSTAEDKNHTLFVQTLNIDAVWTEYVVEQDNPPG